MSDKKYANEARKAFRSSHSKAPLTEYEEEQLALRKNLERLKAERLAREAAKSKDDGTPPWASVTTEFEHGSPPAGRQ
jgi:hypothetical protein